MTEARIGFLYNIATTLSKTENDNNTLLMSYYLMRCKDITRGYGLPDKHFSSKVRCPNCCIEWKNSTEIKVRAIKLSKRQKQRLKSKQIKQNIKAHVRSRCNLLVSNELEQICSFCKKGTLTTVLKPQKLSLTNTTNHYETKEAPVENPKNSTKPEPKNVNPKSKKAEINVYANAMDVFSMQNKNNILASTIKEKPKVIKNNKKKKDKFAGLCQKAVLASAKLKKEKEQSKPLNLFLKPSST